MNNDKISEALNSVSDRQIHKNDIELLTMENGKRSTSKALRIAFTAACAAAVLGVGLTAGAAATRGFTIMPECNTGFEFTQMKLTAMDIEGAPEKIEVLYRPTYLPEGIILKDTYLLPEDDAVEYYMSFGLEDSIDYPFPAASGISFKQITKNKFNNFIGLRAPKFAEIKEVTVNGKQGYLSTEDHYKGEYQILIWDNGDYIMQITCILPEAEVMKIAESVTVDENASVETGKESAV